MSRPKILKVKPKPKATRIRITLANGTVLGAEGEDAARIFDTWQGLELFSGAAGGDLSKVPILHPITK